MSGPDPFMPLDQLTCRPGHLPRVVNCRETRVTAVVAHILVLASVLLIPHPIAYIPRAVLNGLFLYMAVTSLDGLQMFERILLLFTEQVSLILAKSHYVNATEDN